MATKQLYGARAANLIFSLLPVRSSGAGSRWHLADLLPVFRPGVSVRQGPRRECAEFIILSSRYCFHCEAFSLFLLLPR